MSFNPKTFLQNSSGTAAAIIAQPISSVINTALGIAGMSIGGISTTLSNKLDSIISSGGSSFFGIAGQAVERISPQELASNRGQFDTNTNNDPTTAIAASQAKINGQTFTYPPDMSDYYIQFQFSDYSRPSPLSKVNFKTNMTVQLPIPRELTEPNNIGYDNKSFGVVGGLVDSLMTDWRTAGGVNQESMHQLLNRALDQGAGIAYGAAYNLGKMVTGSLGLGDAPIDAVGQFFGAIPNPHMSSVFSGPTFREYSFGWRLAPNNAQESQLIKEMIKALHSRILPTRSLADSANILNYPNIVRPILFPKELSDLIVFKLAVIKSMNVNYAPTGMPSFFAGTKLPTLIDLRFNLQEIEYALGDDESYGGKGIDSGFDTGAAIKAFANNVGNLLK